MRWRLIAIVVSVLAPLGLSESFITVPMPRDFVERRLKLNPETQPERLKILRTMFLKDGCSPDQISEEKLPGQALPNLLCSMPGKVEGTIVVAARSDYTERGQKGMVQWGSLAMLSFLALQESMLAHRYTYVFVALTSNGASGYIQQLSQRQRKTTLAVVDLDSIGRASPQYACAQINSNLLKWLVLSSRWQKLPNEPSDMWSSMKPSLFAKRNDLWVATARDYTAFTREGLASILVVSPSAIALPDIAFGGYAPEVQTIALDIKAYEDTYRLLSMYLVVLDQELGESSISSQGKNGEAASPR